MTESIELIVEETSSRLDKYLADNTEFSRAYIQQLIREERVLVGGMKARPSRGITRNEKILILIPELETAHIEAEDIPLSIIYEDHDVIVIDKPAGMTVHPAAGNWTGTLVNAIMAHCPDLTGIKGTVRPGIVHRLDKDTSGVIIAAKNDAAHFHLAEQIKNREVTKIYLALVKGTLTPAQGAVEGPIGRHPKDRKKMAIITHGKEASTVYKVIRYYKDHSFLEVHPVTGRTHQIRVHLSAIGHPVLGDAIYGGKADLLSRQFLHAHLLGIRLPSDNKYIEFKSELPHDLAYMLHHLES